MNAEHCNLLTRDAIRRLLVSMITHEQSARIAKGAIGKQSSLDRMTLGLTARDVEAIEIEEDNLGFDSLARLDLIMRINQFFGLHTTGLEDYLLVRRRIGDWTEIVQKHFEMKEGKVTLTFQTSGSSGPTKAIFHGIDELLAEVDTVALLVPSTRRILSVVPPHHIFGFLFTCLLPSRIGVEVVDLHTRAPTSVFRTAQAGDLIIATPHIWSHLGRSGTDFVPGVRGVTSAGPSDAATWAIRQTAKLTEMLEVYGATETAGIGTRTDPTAAFKLFAHLNRVDDTVWRASDMRQLDTQDRLTWAGPRSFHVMGRRDDVVQVAGVNVSPSYIARIIGDIDGVAEAVVRPGHERLRAFIVPANPQTNRNEFEQTVRRAINARLEAAARPNDITFGNALPRNNMGKLADWG